MSENNNLILVTWDEKYATNIEQLDNQHKELVELTNKLFQACLAGEETVNTMFKDAMHHMVEYVRFHFSAEQKLLERINFPDLPEHKKQHDDLVRTIIDTVKDFEKGKKFVPNTFVRTLRDWIFGHIAVYDMKYAAFVADQKKKGLLTDHQLG